MNIKKTGSRWLWSSKQYENQYLCFRQQIELENTIDYNIILSCDTNYELWINGEFVSFGQYLSLPEDKYYDKIKIDKYLKKGKNVICILVYYQGVGTFCYKTGTAGLIYAIEHKNTYINNLSALVSEASGYKSGKMELINVQIGPSFFYDAGKETNWKSEDFVPDSTWEKAHILDFCAHLPERISKRPVEKLITPGTEKGILKGWGSFIPVDGETAGERIAKAYMQKEIVTDRDYKNFEIKNDNTHMVIDLGSEITGYFTLSIYASEETFIDIGYGEHIDDMGLRMATTRYAFSYKCKKGENVFTNHFLRIAGRYIQLNFGNVGSGLTVRYAGVKKAQYPVKIKRKPEINDALHSKIYDVCVNTLIQCMHEHYEDCPSREQALYGFDSRNQALLGYFVFDNHRFSAASIDLLGKSMEDDGYLSICSPCSSHYKIPGYTVMWMVAMCEYILYGGSKSTGIKYLNEIKRLYSFHKTKMTNGLHSVPCGVRYWNFYDWVDGLEGSFDGTVYDKNTCYNSIFNIMMCYMLHLASKASEKLEIADLFSWFKNEYILLKDSVNKVFYDSKKGVYSTYPLDSQVHHYAQMTQALAICSGICKNPELLCKKMISEAYLVHDSLCTSVFRYQALLDVGGYEEYILREISGIWGKMLYNGATTFYETQNGADDFDGGASLCHGWSAVPLMVYNHIYNVQER